MINAMMNRINEIVVDASVTGVEEIQSELSTSKKPSPSQPLRSNVYWDQHHEWTKFQLDKSNFPVCRQQKEDIHDEHQACETQAKNDNLAADPKNRGIKATPKAAQCEAILTKEQTNKTEEFWTVQIEASAMKKKVTTLQIPDESFAKEIADKERKLNDKWQENEVMQSTVDSLYQEIAELEMETQHEHQLREELAQLDCWPMTIDNLKIRISNNQKHDLFTFQAIALRLWYKWTLIQWLRVNYRQMYVLNVLRKPDKLALPSDQTGVHGKSNADKRRVWLVFPESGDKIRILRVWLLFQ